MAMQRSTVHGSCLCGQVRFEASLPSKWVAHCHCTYCRRAHGAPFVTWVGFESGNFSFAANSAQPRWYVSSPGARRAFCSCCGSPLLFESDRWPGEIHVARALIPDALDKAPGAHVFYEEHVPWLDVADALPRRVSQAYAQRQALQTKGDA